MLLLVSMTEWFMKTLLSFSVPKNFSIMIIFYKRAIYKKLWLHSYMWHSLTLVKGDDDGDDDCQLGKLDLLRHKVRKLRLFFVMSFFPYRSWDLVRMVVLELDKVRSLKSGHHKTLLIIRMYVYKLYVYVLLTYICVPSPVDVRVATCN